MKKTKGFTLIEILVVATIIGLLAAAGAASYTQFNKSSRDAKRKADMEQVRAALEMYKSTNNIYPDSLTTLVSPVKYIEAVPTDPTSHNDYSAEYKCLPAGNCNNYTLPISLESGNTYTVTPYGSTTTSAPTPTIPPVGPGGGAPGNGNDTGGGVPPSN